MSAAIRSRLRHGWATLTLAGSGVVFFAFALYSMSRIAITVSAEAASWASDPVYIWPVVVAFTLGLLLELRAFVQLCRGRIALLRDWWRTLEIHLRIFVGVQFLLTLPAWGLLRFPEAYEEVTETARRYGPPPIPHLHELLFVAIQFIATWVFIQWGLRLLEGAQTAVDRLLVPTSTNSSGD